MVEHFNAHINLPSLPARHFLALPTSKHKPGNHKKILLLFMFNAGLVMKNFMAFKFYL